MRIRRVYRAVATYADGTTITKHYLTRLARDEWADRRRQGYPEDEVRWGDTRTGEDDGPRPPAVRVDVADSDPIIFPGDFT